LEVAEAQHLMDGLDWQGAIKDIQASVKWLKENGSSKVVFLPFFFNLCLSFNSSLLCFPYSNSVIGWHSKHFG
jgi:carboxymethylenebutenolidase